MGSKTLFNAVFIRPEQVVRFLLCMSERTLRSRLRSYGLKRRQPDYNIDEIRELIQEKLRGPACMGGYRSIWHALRISGYQVPRRVLTGISALHT